MKKEEEITDNIIIVPVRELSYEDAKKEIIEYLKSVGKRKVYISEIIEKLRLDIELTEEIVHKWRDQECRNLCAEDGLYGYTSYTCPVVDCRFNNYDEKIKIKEVNKIKMSGDLRGEWKLLKVWECHRCKTLIRMGRETSTHKCEIKENELSISNNAIEKQKNIIEEQKKTIESQKGIIEEQLKLIGDRDKLIEERLKIIEDRDKLIENQKNAIGSHKGTIKEQKKTIDSQKAVIDEQNKTIKDKAEEDQNKIIEELKKTIEGHRRAIDNQKISIDDRDRIIYDQKRTIESQKRIIRDKEIEEKVANKNIPRIDNKDNGGIKVHIWEQDKPIKDSKDMGYREDIEIEIFEKGKGKDRIIIKNGRLTKKPDHIDIIGEYTPEGFIMKGIYKS